MPAGARVRSCGTLLRNLLLATVLYAAVHGTIHLAQSPAVRAQAKTRIQSSIPHRLGKVGSHKTVAINPHANTFNRPDSAVTAKDDFLGGRPHVDTEAHLQLLCRGDGIEKMRNVFDCLQFLANGEQQYYYLPDPPDRASEQDPREAEYLDADGNGNTLSHYSFHQAASKSGIGNCNGPVIPYHVYWAGAATWRVEVFIKAYLHTQNLPCSRLWLWLDADQHPTAVDQFLKSDELFSRFLPLVERGDIKVLAWNFPMRIPLPAGMDHIDGIGHYSIPGALNARGERVVADGVIEDADGQQWISLTAKQMTFFPQAISDAVRFVVLHLHGGVYLDMDVLLLRDMRPLLLPQEHAFAERWGTYPHPGDYNTAIMSLSANSSLSSYLLRGGVRMGLNFHPRVIGRMAWKDGRDRELLMLETAAFDPILTDFNRVREGRCTVPCLRDYGAPFKGKTNALRDEWESYDDQPLVQLDMGVNTTSEAKGELQNEAFISHLAKQVIGQAEATSNANVLRRSVQAVEHEEDEVIVDEMDEPLHSFTSSDAEIQTLKDAGIVKEYRIKEDKYPPTNRTLENFFKGAWTYHVHNQWSKHPEPSSWLAAMQAAHDRFFQGGVNPYGEKWNGPEVALYNRWTEFV